MRWILGVALLTLSACATKSNEGAYSGQTKQEANREQSTVKRKAPETAKAREEKSAAEVSENQRSYREKGGAAPPESPPPVSSRPPGDKAKPPQVSALTWNAWAEDPGIPFSPLAHLHPNSDYELQVDLSAISYDLLDEGRSRVVGPGFDRRVQDWMKDASRPEAILKILVLPDPAYFDHPQEHVQTLRFKLDRLRQTSNLLADQAPGKSAMEVLRGKPEPSFRLGHVSFDLHTTDLQGLGAIGLSFWVDGRPVDELVVSYCIAADEKIDQCKASTRGTVSLRGLDSVRISAQTDGLGRLPDAAIHFVRLDSDQVMGVFRRNNWNAGRFETWRLGRTAAELRAYFENSLLPAFGGDSTLQSLEQRGVEFYNLLFPPPGPREAPDAARGRAEFEQFVREHLSQDTAGTREHRDTPSVFIRMLTEDDNSVPLIPLGLLAMKLDQDKTEFLGFHFRIEAPLGVQNYHAVSECISTWALVLPPARGDLQDVRKGIDESLADFRDGAQYLYDRMLDFGGYLKSGTESDPTALAVVSHHNKNQVYFSSSDMVLSTAVNREFSKPSLAILDGCGTGVSGAADFIKQLNSRGVASVIATNTEIRPEIAVDFLRCLVSELAEHRDTPNYLLSDAYLNTIECLSERSQIEGGAKYGPLALTFSLMGNGNLRLCGPKKRPQ